MASEGVSSAILADCKPWEKQCTLVHTHIPTEIKQFCVGCYMASDGPGCIANSAK